MLFKNSKKINQNQRQRYLRYDDVFLSHEKPRQTNNLKREGIASNFQDSNRFHKQGAPNSHENNGPYIDNRDTPYTGETNSFEEDGFFKTDGDLVNERMINYQQRQLPPLQRYRTPNRQDLFEDYEPYASKDWGEYDDGNLIRRDQNRFFKTIWQKFMVVFCSMLSLVCLSWIAYHWNDDKKSTVTISQDGHPVIVPVEPSYKVLPENPGGVIIPNQDKMVYDKMSSSSSVDNLQNSKLLPPQNPQSNSQFIPQDPSIEEVSIIDDKLYYIKISESASKVPLASKLNSLKNGRSERLSGLECKIKSVRAGDGAKEKAIMIGPLDSKEAAMALAQDMNCDCSIVSVKE